MHWRKSSYSFANGNCVEVGQDGPVVGVRDTRLGDASPVLVFDAGAWRRFTATLTGLRGSGACPRRDGRRPVRHFRS